MSSYHQKEPFLQKVQKRVEDIWSAEDRKAFDDLYLATDITDPSAVERAVTYIQEKARTSSSEKYIAALKACNPQNIEKARTYQKGIRPKIHATISLTFFLFAVANLLLLKKGILISVSCIVASLVFAGLHSSLYQPWKEITVDNTVFHPVLIRDLPERKKGVPAFIIALALVAVLTGLIRLI